MRTGKPWPGARLLISTASRSSPRDDRQGRRAAKVVQGGERRRRRAGVRRGRWQRGLERGRLQGVGVSKGSATRATFTPIGRPIARARSCKFAAVSAARRRRLHDREGEEVHARRTRQPQPSALARNREARPSSARSMPTSCCRRPVPRGLYRVSVHDDAGRNSPAAFQVKEYHLEPLRLTIDTPRKVYYRGEEIEGVVRATYYYARTAGRPRNPLSTGRRPRAHRHNRRKGEVHFKLPTRGVQRDPIVARCGLRCPSEIWRRWPTTCWRCRRFPFREHAFGRPIWRARRSRRRSMAKDAEGKPLGQKLTLKVLELSAVKARSASASSRRTRSGPPPTAWLERR